MKRAAEEMQTPEKRAKNNIKVVDDPSGSRSVETAFKSVETAFKSVETAFKSVETALAYLLLSYAPCLAAPAPRQAWGLDRLVLDAHCAEAAVQDVFVAGGSALPKVVPEHGGVGAPSLSQSSVLSLPGTGQGVPVAVGLAIGQRHLAASLLGCHGTGLFEHRVFLLCSGGALASGAGSESSSLAGHLGLSSLVVVCCYDSAGKCEDVAARYRAYRWSVVTIGEGAGNAAVVQALDAAGQDDKPTLVLVLRGANVVAKAPNDATLLVRRGAAAATSWEVRFGHYAQAHPEEHAEVLRRFRGDLPEGWREGLPEYAVGERAQATRQYSAKVLGSLVTAVPELVGGSADLTGSNLTNQGQLKDFQHGKHKGRYLRFGVRENAMIGICTGLAAYGGFIPFCSTFLNFVTYGWGALRLAAFASAPVIYVATHDSIELGEDGPTHQPIEVIAACRALPRLLVFRPADGNETVGAYEAAMLKRDRPSLLALGRSGSPHLKGSARESVARGGYVLSDGDSSLFPAVVIAASGTEVVLCVEVKDALESVGVGVRVVSMPCWELFEAQPEAYRLSVFESAPSKSAGPSPLRVYVEAAADAGFHRYAELHLCMSTFGASGTGKDVRKYFGFEKSSIAAKIMEVLRERNIVKSYRLGRFGFCKFGAAVMANMAD